ncbi:MAG: hypothetical protein H7A45_06105 [Verrucomicrobiales bacterium]|nr:hypothetical protein [Verrucomicrobiales bacterium]MCP5528102.1 hypothetical protein [Verrucomicrobiales bacterium]
MQAKQEIRTGRQLALGVLLGSALIVPALGFMSFKAGLLTGVLSALIVLAWYGVVALRAGDAGRG